MNRADIYFEAYRLLGLLDYFDIPYSHPNRWFELAIALARKHYRQGAPNPIGRPKLGSIAKLYGMVRKRGRPKKYPRAKPVRPRGRPGKSREFIESIHSRVEKYKEEDPRATDKQAIESFLKDWARDTKRSSREALKELPRLQKALSRYRGELRRQSP